MLEKKSNQRRRVNIKVTGQVQGVFFRYSTKAEAERLGLTGFVRNEPDGSVKIVAEGEEEALQKLVEWCRKGTEYSKVEKVDIMWQEATGEFTDFAIT